MCVETGYERERVREKDRTRRENKNENKIRILLLTPHGHLVEMRVSMIVLVDITDFYLNTSQRNTYLRISLFRSLYLSLKSFVAVLS